MRRDEKQGDRPSAMCLCWEVGGSLLASQCGAQEGGWGVSISFMRLKLLRKGGATLNSVKRVGRR